MKVVFGLLALLVIAFVLIIRGGSASAMAGVQDTPEWLRWIGARSRPKMDLRDLGPTCFSYPDKTFVITSGCVTRVSHGKRFEQFRVLRLTLRSGVSAVVHFDPAPNDDSGVAAGTRPLKPGLVESFVIPKVGGSLTIECMPPGSCSIGAE